MGIKMVQHSDIAIRTLKYQMSHYSNPLNLKIYTYNFFLSCFVLVNKLCLAVLVESPNISVYFQFANNLSMKIVISSMALVKK